ncbi:MAG: peptide-methionine (S)-S-oxide reductase MsrA [Gammaproteobacteria bacterium]|nr:peptide-methionine (S)-S-oxide reductase MsrA [Gammaproteobacteria bacterium]NVK88840.1 peptide-methionine (S)-S-oxide reductase MsrA [Gammaproteobacteria bacterium]
MNSIILGGGCFWCLEAVFQRVNGVTSVKSGYAGGHVDNPNYRDVCAETTGHAEVVAVEFDESIIGLDEILTIFFTIHDPTTLNRQGNDIGTQYRSVIVTTKEQRPVVEQALTQAAKQYAEPIVTEVLAPTRFWPAENYHDNYYNQNSQQPYCQIVVGEKVAKLNQYFKDKVKT